jgi:hypothetical protein
MRNSLFLFFFSFVFLYGIKGERIDFLNERMLIHIYKKECLQYKKSDACLEVAKLLLKKGKVLEAKIFFKRGCYRKKRKERKKCIQYYKESIKKKENLENPYINLNISESKTNKKNISNTRIINRTGFLFLRKNKKNKVEVGTIFIK